MEAKKCVKDASIALIHDRSNRQWFYHLNCLISAS